MRLPKVYFYCCPEEDNLQEDVITLAEGLQELGVPYYASCDYWLQSLTPGDYLFKADAAVRPDDCDLVIVSYTWPKWTKMRTFEGVQRPLPAGLFKPGRRYLTVYMDHHDGHRTVSWDDAYRQFDVIFRDKLNQRAWYPSNLRPWALALNRRIIRATEGGPPFAERRRVMLVNYGASHHFLHGTRLVSAARFEPRIARVLPLDRTVDNLGQPPSDPYAALMWRQTGGRYSPAYYERLKHAQSVACFCGALMPPMPYRHPDRLYWGGHKARLQLRFYEILGALDPRPPRAMQWDSFRFWETLAAGAAAFNVDLAHYGVELPVMPRNGVDYIGVDLARPEKAVALVRDDPAALERIAAQGRAWAFQHYSPAAQARRLLAAVGHPLP
ncbi:MAG TPA: hypothetical protein VG936_12735 [Lacunisphaera sp.]|nr:hypothetical protein [Lacunisphaera sp.]